MNDTKELEARLRSWAPRRPSRSIETRLFGRTNPVPAPDEARFGVQWLAPATAAVLGLLLLFNYREGWQTGRIEVTGVLAQVALSNQSATASVSATSIQMHNTLAADTFEWTNGSGSFSSVYSVSPRKGTNH